jgi:hypothetical protein
MVGHVRQVIEKRDRKYSAKFLSAYGKGPPLSVQLTSSAMAGLLRRRSTREIVSTRSWRAQTIGSFVESKGIRIYSLTEESRISKAEVARQLGLYTEDVDALIFGLGILPATEGRTRPNAAADGRRRGLRLASRDSEVLRFGG